MVFRNTKGLGPAELPEVFRRQSRHYIEAAGPPPPLSGRVHICARVSTTDQAEDNKTSLDQQVRLCLEAIVREGIERPVGIWRDEGYTGFSRLAERPVGKAMLAALRPGDTICIHCVDRFSRQMLAGIADMNELRCREVGIYFAETRDFVPPGSGVWDNNKEFNFHMRMVVAHSERATFRARVTRAQQQLLQRGFWLLGAHLMATV
jgi:putative DNA-invertase from lambdoid prophage Rac